MSQIGIKKQHLIESLDRKLRDFNKKSSSVFTKNENKEEFKKKVEYCVWKMKAIWYHHNNIQSIEMEHIDSVIQDIRGKYLTGEFKFFTIEKVEFEFEAFFFQSKACLDIFSRSFKPYLKNESRNTKGLKKELALADTQRWHVAVDSGAASDAERLGEADHQPDSPWSQCQHCQLPGPPG